MTTYTADDFKNARFAEHPESGRIAARLRANKMWGWTAGRNEDRLRDDEMAGGGWVPVPAGSYTRTDDDGLTLRLVQQQRDQATARAERAERDAEVNQVSMMGWAKTSESWQETAEEWESRALKAEGERDEARAERDSWRAQVPLAAWEKELIRATGQPCPLTADDITDEMVERARNAPSFDGRLSPTPRLVREMLTAALTAPPARPEGAEDVAVRLFQAGAAVGVEMTAEQRDALADHLAAMHVRVVGEEQS